MPKVNRCELASFIKSFFYLKICRTIFFQSNFTSSETLSHNEVALIFVVSRATFNLNINTRFWGDWGQFVQYILFFFVRMRWTESLILLFGGMTRLSKTSCFILGSSSHCRFEGKLNLLLDMYGYTSDSFSQCVNLSIYVYILISTTGKLTKLKHWKKIVGKSVNGNLWKIFWSSNGVMNNHNTFLYQNSQVELIEYSYSKVAEIK